jgi:hypothetical protein
MSVQATFDESEQPVKVGEISWSDKAIYIPLKNGAPQKATSGKERWYDWVVFLPQKGSDASKAAIVADLDASSGATDTRRPRQQVWNKWEVEDRTAGSDGIVNTGIVASLITNADQGRTRYWVKLEQFDAIGKAIARKKEDGTEIIASKFAVFLGIGGAPVNSQKELALSGDRLVYMGDITKNGPQYFPFKKRDGRYLNFTVANGSPVSVQFMIISR